MIIEHHELRTPYDYPWAYDPWWRHELAKVTLEHPHHLLPDKYVFDDYVKRQRTYLLRANTNGFDRYVSSILVSGIKHPMRSIVLANRLFSSTGLGTGKDRVEALLLCPELTYAHICRYFDLTPDDVEVYQHLFFNCRDDEGKLKLPHGVMQYFATRNAVAAQSSADHATNWRTFAFQGGSRLLFLEWKWPYDKEHIAGFSEVELWSDLLPKVYQRIEERLRFDQGLDGRALMDCANMVRQALADLRKEGIVGSGEGLSDDTLAMQFVSALAPYIMQASESMVDRKQGKLDTKLEMMGRKDAEDTTGDTSMANITRQLNKQES